MRAQKVAPKRFEFYFPDLDNLVLVEHLADDSVLIRATQDNFSERRKSFFIRRLATEGFIPDAYQWFYGSINGCGGLRWTIDRSWLELHPIWTRRARRFMIPLLCCSVVLWLAMMRLVIVSQPGYSPTAGFAEPQKNQAPSIHLVPDKR